MASFPQHDAIELLDEANELSAILAQSSITASQALGH